MSFASANFDLKIIQCGDTYTVSGRNAVMVYEKLQHIPQEARTLKVSGFKNGSFTMRKIAPAAQPSAAASSA